MWDGLTWEAVLSDEQPGPALHGLLPPEGPLQDQTQECSETTSGTAQVNRKFFLVICADDDGQMLFFNHL